MSHKYIFLSGLPRSGTNMLSSILNQNPEIHSEGISSVCRFLWNTHNFIENDNNGYLKNEMSAVNRFNKNNIKNIFQSILNGYYYEIDKKIIVDKNFSWTTKENLYIIQNYFENNYKIIILERNIKDIVISFKNIYLKNGWTDEFAEKYIFSPGNPLMRPLSSLIWSKINKNKNFIFIDYDQFIKNPNKYLNEINIFIDSYFEYDLNNIILKYPENEKYTPKQFMGVRQNISKRILDVSISKYAENKIEEINHILYLCSKNIIDKNDMKKIISFYENNL